MTASPTFAGLFALRRGVPNHADRDNATSRHIAESMLEQMGRLVPGEPKRDMGRAFERAIQGYLGEALQLLDPGRLWLVGAQDISRFRQYRHIAAMEALAEAHPILRVEMGRDYLIRPDVTVGVVRDEGDPFLHAAVSAKWTIRSDRVQNIRHEAVIMTRTRRGRLPHLVAVTAEPLPSRLASIARGTGEVDAVYHVAMEELVAATNLEGTEEQKRTLDELVGQSRLFSVEALPEILTQT